MLKQRFPDEYSWQSMGKLEVAFFMGAVARFLYRKARADNKQVQTQFKNHLKTKGNCII